MRHILAGFMWSLGLGLWLMAQSPQDLPLGEVIPRIICQEDTSQSYALFLPSYYTPDRSWPTLFVFDPVARGELALNVFKRSAERFGYILAGSNNARNGPMEPIIEAINHMSPDLDRRVKVDARRLYATGFSGGSRVASLVGMHTGALAGVIGCGAGFPQLEPPSMGMSFDYIGLIGNVDMNYWEMQKLQIALEKTDTRHAFVGFAAGHQWPPQATIETAFTWLEFRAMDRGLVDFSPVFLENYLSWASDSLQRLQTNKNDFGSYVLMAEISQTLIGIPEAREAYQEWEMKRVAQEALPSVQQRFAQQKEINRKEAAYLESYQAEFKAIELSPFKGDSTMAPGSWWKKEVRELNELITESPEEEEQWLGQRMIDYLWRRTFILWRGSFQAEKYALARKFAYTWTLIQPEVPGPYYVMAKTEIANGANNRGLKQLRKAVELGFNRKDFLEQDAGFDAIRDHKKYKELLAMIPEP